LNLLNLLSFFLAISLLNLSQLPSQVCTCWSERKQPVNRHCGVQN
jgi:hypothetical protein